MVTIVLAGGDCGRRIDDGGIYIGGDVLIRKERLNKVCCSRSRRTDAAVPYGGLRRCTCFSIWKFGSVVSSVGLCWCGRREWDDLILSRGGIEGEKGRIGGGDYYFAGYNVAADALVECFGPSAKAPMARQWSEFRPGRRPAGERLQQQQLELETNYEYELLR